jgi:hypothetical protein
MRIGVACALVIVGPRRRRVVKAPAAGAQMLVRIVGRSRRRAR